MYVPTRPCEELLKNQFEAAAHSAHSNESADTAPESFVVVMATHGRTSEAARALQSVRISDAKTVPLGSIVLIDEAVTERERTSAALTRLPNVPQFLFGDGDLYWSKSLLALLEKALQSDADYIIHLNTDVTMTTGVETLLAPMRSDARVGAVVGLLAGDVPIRGYRPVHFWFPFFRSVKPGQDAAILPGSCIAYRSTALRSLGVALSALGKYQHGWADVELSYQLREAGYRLATCPDVVGTVQHQRYFRRKHHFELYGGSFLRYIKECPTAPCLEDTRRIGTRLFGRCWPVMLRVYAPVAWQWLQFRFRRAGH